MPRYVRHIIASAFEITRRSNLNYVLQNKNIAFKLQAELHEQDVCATGDNFHAFIQPAQVFRDLRQRGDGHENFELLWHPFWYFLPRTSRKLYLKREWQHHPTR